MTLDPPFPPPTHAPVWAGDLYDWLLLVQDQVDQHSATLSRNSASLNQLKGKLVTQQDEIDAVVAQEQAAEQRVTALISGLQGATTDLRAQVASLEAQVADLQAQGTPVTLDFAGLHAVADQLDAIAPPTP